MTMPYGSPCESSARAPVRYGGPIGRSTDSRPLMAAYSSQVHPVGLGGYLPFFKGIPQTSSSQDLVMGRDVCDA
jgi:hypothetical protein